MKVIVVGAGGTGSAAARSLALAGHSVLAFEQYGVGHTWGSSHGASRIIRYTYADEVYTRMMGAAYPLWRELQEEAGEELLARTGGVFFRNVAQRFATRRDVLSAQGSVLSGGRYDFYGTHPALYLSCDVHTCVEETTRSFTQARAAVAQALPRTITGKDPFTVRDR